MLDNIIRFSIRNKLIVGLLTLALVLWGSYSLTQLPIDAVPDITNNQVQVITQSPSLAAQEIERLITFPVEQAMATIPEIEEIRSMSRFGLSVVTIVFKEQTDIYWARQQVSERLTEAQSNIPAMAGTPSMAPVTTGLGEIYQYVLLPKPGYEDKFSTMELRSIQDWIVRRQLLGTKGVADVSSFGGHLKQYEIALNTNKMHSHGISIQDVFHALEANNQNTGGAYIDKKPNAYFIRTEGLIGTLSDIEKIQIPRTSSGPTLLIRDIASVAYGHANRYGAMTRNGQGEVVGALVLMLKGENSNKVITRVKDRMAQIEKTLPKGLKVEPFLDRSRLVNNAINTVCTNLIEGALIVIFVLVLFLGNLRGGLIVASMIPLCMLFAVSLMNVFGVSGNLMSLGAIDFGLIVDGAVIIVEASLFHLGQLKTKKLSQEQMDQEVYHSSTQIRGSAAFGELIILIVYLPILVLAGVEGKMFKPMAQTVAFSILGAFLLSLTYIPMMSALFLSKHIEHKRNFSDRLMDFFHRLYQPMIQLSLKHKKTVVLAAWTLLLGSLWVFSTMGGEFIPSLDEGDFAVETRVLTGSSLSHTIATSSKAEQLLLKKFPEIKQVVCKIGSSEIPTDPMPIESCDMMIILKDKDEWTSAHSKEELVEKMAKELEAIPGVTFGFQQPIQMRFNELMTGVRQDVAIKIFGEDLQTLTALSKKISKMIKNTSGAEDIYVEQVTGLPQIVAKINRDKLYQFHVNVDDVNKAVNASFAGLSAGLVYEGEKRYDLVVRLEKQGRATPEDVSNLYVSNREGQQIPLSQLAEVSLSLGPNQIQREDAKRRLTVGFNVRGRDVESIVQEVRHRIDSEIDFPTGYFVTYGGQFENLVEAKQRLAIAVPVALGLIFVLLFFTFNSIKQSLLIFTAIPLSAIGGIWALYLRGMPFSISAGIGFIALFGVSVLNGIVLIGEFNRLRKEGLKDLHQIVRQGTAIRLRPILMTALVASMGFLPMALSTGSGAEVQKPLATVVIGGLLTATLLTLIILPILYIWFEKVNVKAPATAVIFMGIIGTMMFDATEAQAQDMMPNLESSIQHALAKHPNITSADYFIKLNEALIDANTDLGKTTILATYGQYNSYRNDLNLTASQSFSFPTVYVRLAALAKANLQGSRLQKSVVQNELIFHIKQTWNHLEYLSHRQRLLQQHDSLYTVYAKAADLKHRTGEGTYLQKITAETQLYEAKNQRSKNKDDIGIYLKRLATLLYHNGDLAWRDSTLSRKTLTLPQDSMVYLQNPALAYMRQQIVINEQQQKMERSKLLPDFQVGYFNQTLTGFQDTDAGAPVYYGHAKKFQGLLFGLSIPLWAKPQIARLKAADYQVKMAQTDYAHLQRSHQNQYAELLLEYQKLGNSLTYYEKNVLPQAQLMLSHAQKGYRAGEISAIEYVTALNKALEIEAEHLNLLVQYNQSIINIEFIIGNQ